MPNFGKSERERQAHFRDSSLTINPAARRATDEKGRRYEYLLAHGHEEENLYPAIRGPEGALRFFDDRDINWWHSGASGDRKGYKGPTRNLASSQIACVNFFLPLADNPKALTRALQDIDRDVKGVVPIEDAGRSSFVEFEWTGVGSTLEGKGNRGANATSVDAFLVANVPSGKRAYLIETKYVEEYRKNDLGKGNPGKTRKSRYRDLYEVSDSSLNGTVPLEALLFNPFYQLMRLRLLADRMVRDRELGVSEAKVVVSCPAGNTAYRERITSHALARKFPHLRTVHDVFTATLKDPKGFACTEPERLGRAVCSVGGPEIERWWAYHQERYGWNP